MFRSLLRSPKNTKTILVPPNELVTWIESQVCAQVPRTLIYQELLEMKLHTDIPTLYEAAAKDVMAIMHIRNHRGTKLELAGQTEAAIAEYEANVRDLYGDLYPYHRLRILYEQRQDYQNAVRVCETCLRVAGCLSGPHKAIFIASLQRCKHKLELQHPLAGPQVIA